MERFRDDQAACPGELAEYCLIEAMLRVDPAIELPLRIRATDFGKPFFADSQVEFSISHAGNYAAATVSDCPVGTDIEKKRTVREALVKRICTGREWEEIWLRNPTEDTFLRLFSAKESIVKRSGEGIRSLSNVDTEEYPVRQTALSEYVLSVCSGSVADWEVVHVCG